MRAISSMVRRAGSTVAPFTRVLAATSGRRVLGMVFAGVVSLMAALPGHRGVAWAEVRDPHGVAVIVGNGDYEHRDVPDVRYAHRDGAAFRQYVVEVLGYDPRNIIEVKDADQATMESVFGNERSHEGKLWRFLNPRGSDVVVFYSGHGVPSLKDKRSYLLPVNAHPDTPEINGYPLGLLYRNLLALDWARSIRVFVDACFSGGSGDGGCWYGRHHRSPSCRRRSCPRIWETSRYSPRRRGSRWRPGTTTRNTGSSRTTCWMRFMATETRTERRGDRGGGKGLSRRAHDVRGAEDLREASERHHGRRCQPRPRSHSVGTCHPAAPGARLHRDGRATPRETRPASGPGRKGSAKDDSANEIEGRILLTGAVQAHAKGDYPAVLSFVTQLDKLE